MPTSRFSPGNIVCSVFASGQLKKKLVFRLDFVFNVRVAEERRELHPPFGDSDDRFQVIAKTLFPYHVFDTCGTGLLQVTIF